ncbi:MAG TPA: efflux RND transporter permease subunit, partial [Candidatus Krumholzibacteria bacterium]|nr:efflux RND transporter permease subunit [Candidatus Krumholzibacteria bacterium]
MSLSTVCIQRPVLTIVFAIVIVVFGIVGFSYLGVREYPNVDPAVITVRTEYTGSNSDVIDSQITQPLEEDISAVPGIRYISSVSREGQSDITIEFNLGVDLEAAANDVRDKVSGAVGSLPPDVDLPRVSKADADATPIVVASVSSPVRDLMDLSNIAEKVFKERLQTIPGVSEVRIYGEKRYAMRLWMDPLKMAAHGVTPLDVRTALNAENVELPSGRIEGATVELPVRTLSRLETPEQFNRLIIRESGNNLLRFSDIGTAELGPEEERRISMGLTGPRVAVALVPQPGSNHIVIADEFYRRMAQLQREVPDDIVVGVAWDTTRYIRKSIHEVRQTIFVAFLLVVLIIFLFLRDWRTTLIPVLAIPISLIGVFFVMFAAGFSINVLTLLGLVLAIGLVVDDAIVMLENIYSKIESGMNPIDAGFTGSREVFFAIIATTAALVAVFMPIVFLQGLTGRLFKEFGVVIGGAVVISSFVALTLTPMLASHLLRPHAGHSAFYRRTEPFFARLNDAYRRSLAAFMHRRWLAVVVIVGSVGLMALFLKTLPRELAPLEDRSRLRITATGAEGTSFERMSAYMDRVIDLIRRDVPEADVVLANTSGFAGGANAGNATIALVPPEERQRSQQQIADGLSQAMKELNDARTFVTQEQTISVGGGSARFGLPVQYVLEAPTLAKLKEALPRFQEAASHHPAFSVVDVNLKFNKPELLVEIDRERARTLGVSVADVAQTLQLSFSGQRYGYFTRDGKQYQVIGQLRRSDRNEPVDLASVYVRNRAGELIQLDNVINYSESSNPPQLYRYNRYVSATISAGLNPGYTLSDGIAAMHDISDKVLDESFSSDLGGAAR